MKMGFCRRISGARVVRSRYRERYRQKYTLRYRQDCENGWLRELSSQRISSQLSKMPTSWLLGFRFSSLSSRKSLSFLCGSGACGAKGLHSLRSLRLCLLLLPPPRSLQGSRLGGTRPHRFGGRERGKGGSLPMCSQGTKKPTLSGVGLVFV